MTNERIYQLWSDAYGIPGKTGDVGVELELEGTHLPKEVTGWVIKHEQSLRGLNGRAISQGEDMEDTPREYVTYRPISISGLSAKLKTLAKALETAEVRITDRASTHIHVNMTTRTLRSIIGFIVIYTIIEPVLMRICGPQRNGNLFCLPSYETGEMPDFMSKLVQSVILSPRKYWPSRRGKYAALNTDPLVTFGSLEVRCFPNSIEPDTIHRWATWLVNIRGLADTWGDATYQTLLTRAYEEPSWILEAVFGSYNVFHDCAPNNPWELVHFGVEQAYEVLRPALGLLGEGKPQLQPKTPSIDDSVYEQLDAWEPPPVPDFYDEPEED